MRVWLLGVLAACYSPSPPAGAPCPNGACPSGQYCVAGVCSFDPGGDGGIVVDAACGACSADHAQFVPCRGQPLACPLGCSTTGGDHCTRIVPSNDLDPSSAFMTAAVTITGTATFDTDTGEITGALTRAAGTGVIAQIRYDRVTSGGADIGVFGMDSLDVAANATVQFVGTRAAAFVVEHAVTIAGTIDASAGCANDRSCAGPGGRDGSRMGAPTSGACSGGDGVKSPTNPDDGGGGGGGGGEMGGAGGMAAMAASGTAGGVCITAAVIPLVGGGGGGAGGPGTSEFPVGGGGGGAIQIVSHVSITIAGTIHVGGNGGDPGRVATGNGNAAAGGGGGGGGAVLLEAPLVKTTGTIAANGGGGGGAGNSSVGPGQPGADATASSAIAMGGAGTATNPGPGDGGNGGAGSTSPTRGGDGANGGGGGGARGAIRINAPTAMLQGSASPMATTGMPVTR